MTPDALARWIEEREKLAEKATKGPWTYAEWTPQGGYKRYCIGTDDAIGQIVMSRSLHPENGRFIADARTSLPQALRMLRVCVEALSCEVLASLECPCCTGHEACDSECTIEVDAPEVAEDLRINRASNERIRRALRKLAEMAEAK